MSGPKMVKWVNPTRDYFASSGVMVKAGTPFELPEGEKPPSGSIDEAGNRYVSGAQIFAPLTPIVPPKPPPTRGPALSEIAGQKPTKQSDRK